MFSYYSMNLCCLNKWRIVFFQGMEQQCENICLIPELCYMTGLTDELRSDFRVMKVMFAVYIIIMRPNTVWNCIANFRPLHNEIGGIKCYL